MKIAQGVSPGDGKMKNPSPEGAAYNFLPRMGE